MRFALAATGIAAIVAVPLALSAAGPAMSGEAFVSAVRCAAYEDVIDPNADLGPVKLQLNLEAQRQPAETAALAEREADAIALQAVNVQTDADAAILSQERARACSGAQLAAGSVERAV